MRRHLLYRQIDASSGLLAHLHYHHCLPSGPRQPRLVVSWGIHVISVACRDSGFLDGMALIFFLLHKSRKVKLKTSKAAPFQLMKRGSIPSFHLIIFSSTSCAAPILGARHGLFTPNNILLMRGYSGHLFSSGFKPTSHASWFSIT